MFWGSNDTAQAHSWLYRLTFEVMSQLKVMAAKVHLWGQMSQSYVKITHGCKSLPLVLDVTVADCVLFLLI